MSECNVTFEWYRSVYIYVCMLTFAVAPSITNVIAVLDTSNQYMDTHSISLTCIVHPESEADLCEAVLISSGNIAIIGMYIVYWVSRERF